MNARADQLAMGDKIRDVFYKAQPHDTMAMFARGEMKA
jgi:hypothetical protein